MSASAARRHLTAGVLVVMLAASLAASWAATPVAGQTLPPLGSDDVAEGDYVDPAYEPTLTADGVIYGSSTAVDGNPQDLVLDVLEPAGDDREFRPVIVWAAGGGFVHNRGRDRVYWMPEMVRRGYVVVSIEYRVRPDMPYGFEGIVAAGPAAVQEAQDAARDAQHDMQAAIRWVRANAADLRIDPYRVIAAGYSAGAIMSLLTAYASDDAGNSGNPGWPSHVAAAVSGAGGILPGAQAMIEPGEPPVLMFHGTHDTTVPIVSSLLPCAAATAVANVCELRVYPGQQHGVGDVLPEEMTRETVDFLHRRVIAAPRTATAFADLSAVVDGTTIAVAGRLLTDAGAPVAQGRVLVRGRDGGWAETTTGPDGTFAVQAVGPQSEVPLRYEGYASGSWLDGQPLAPSSATVVTARRAGGP